MSERVEILDIVAIVRSYLLEQEPVTTIVVDRISHRSPGEGDFEQPWVRITQVDARNETGTNEVEHLVSYYLQIDCYAGEGNRYGEAFDLSAAVRAALVGLPGNDLDGAVVTDIGFLSMPSQPDEDLKPARERMVLDAEIFAHPN